MQKLAEYLKNSKTHNYIPVYHTPHFFDKFQTWNVHIQLYNFQGNIIDRDKSIVGTGKSVEDAMNDAANQMLEKLSKNYWIGPFGVKIPNDITTVPWIDGVNIFQENGYITDKSYQGHSMNKETYLNLYATRDEKGEYWFTGRKMQSD